MLLPVRVSLALFLALFATSAIAQGSAPPGFVVHHLNASVNPVTADGVTTFKILPEDCSDVPYGNGSGEDDCMNGNTKSILYHEATTKLGESYEYGFDILVDKGFPYAGILRSGFEALPFRPGSWDSDLRIATWEGPMRKSFIYTLKLDSTKGLTFNGLVCAPPSSFGTWVNFKMKVRWDNARKGWVQVTCDGRTIFIEEGVATNRQTQCYIHNECLPGVNPNPKTFNFQVGLSMQGNGGDWKENGQPGKFIEIPAEGLTLRMRNISQSPGAVLYGPEELALVAELQTKLNELGCAVGTPDGVIGPKTRQQALACRAFGADEMPLTLNAVTLATFVELYSRPGAAELPAGSPSQPPEYVLHVAGGADDMSEPDNTVYPFGSFIEWASGDLTPLNFVLFGDKYNAEERTFGLLGLKLEDNISDKAADKVSACPGNQVETHADDGTHHLVIGLSRKGNEYRTTNFDCVLEALPKGAAFNAAFLIDHFRDFATTLVNEGSLRTFTNEPARTFVERIASGEIVVARGGTTKARYVIHLHEKKALSFPTSPQVQSILEGTVIGYPDVSNFEFVLSGQFDIGEQNFSQLSLIVTNPPWDNPDLASCKNSVDQSLDGTPRMKVNLERNGSDLVATNADCLIKALSGEKRAAVKLFADYFFEIAAGAEADGAIAEMKSPHLQTFLHNVAAGEITVSRPTKN